MKTIRLSRLVLRLLVLLGLVTLGGGNLAWGQNTPIPYAVSFWYPTNGQTFAAPANVGVHALVTDSNLVTTVQYFAGTTSIGTVTNTAGVLLTNTTSDNPFFLSWSNVPAGTYSLTAVATDSTGAIAISDPVSITVTSPPAVPFFIGITSPTNKQTYTAPVSFSIYTHVTDSNLVKTVQYYAGGTYLGQSTNSQNVMLTNTTSSSPFYLYWTNISAGYYTLTAVANDAGGLSVTSAPVTILVNPPPPPPFVISITSPTNHQTFYAPATFSVNTRGTDSNVVNTVQFFANDVSLGVATNTSGVLLTNIDTWPTNTIGGNPFVMNWSNVLAGTYTLTAIATDASGLTATSAPVSITVTSAPPIPYGIGFLYPTNGQTYGAVATIGVHAWVTDSNVVNTMQYFANSTSIGLVTNKSGILLTNTSNYGNPFEMNWSNVVAGVYSLTAVAADSTGLLLTSAPISITVTSPPPPPFTISISSPANNQSFTAPATFSIATHVADSNLVDTVQFFSNDVAVGLATNRSGVMLTNTANTSPFYIVVSNVLAGKYTLTAIATDSLGLTATSAPVAITVTNPPPPPPVPFVVALFAPTNGQTFVAPTNLYVHASVTDSNLITTMQYFANGASIGLVTNSQGLLFTNTSNGNPLYLTWSNVLAGNYTLTAVASDNTGLSVTSAPVTITVNPPPPPPSVPYNVGLFYPTNGQTFTAPASVGIHAWVTDSNLVTTIQYFANGGSIGLVTNKAGVLFTNLTSANGFEMNWSNVLAGTYTLTAVATDNGGLMATSAPVTINVTNPPPPPPVPFFLGFYYPTNGQIFTAPANLSIYTRLTDSNIVSTVEFFTNGVSLGVATNSQNVTVTNLTSTSPFYFRWTNVLTGSYTLTAIATDSTGLSATSAPVTITVTAPPPPPPVPFTVKFWYPTNGQTFTAPVNVGVHALVTDSNLVTTVQYFAGMTLIGYATNSSGVLLTNTSESNPFFVSWNNVAPGNYSLTAVATDLAGLSATSAPVNITVKAPPPPPPVPFNIGFWYPTNGQIFTAPANIGVHAWVTDSNLITTIEYLANGASIGLITNGNGVLFTNSTSGNPFEMNWSNVVAGTYSLTAVATDSAGLSVTSAPVTINVQAPPPPKPVPFFISIIAPTNGQTYAAPADVDLYTHVTDSNLVTSVQFLDGDLGIGLVWNIHDQMLTNDTESSPFYLAWGPLPEGTYTFTAIAMDSAGLTATSAPVTITVTAPPPPPPVPFAVSFWYPTNGQVFTAPANVGVHARVTDSNLVTTVEYFSFDTSIGVVTNAQNVMLTNSSQSNPFFLDWSNVPPGSYTLTAVATDFGGLMATSAPVNIIVLSNPPPTVVIYAPNSVAVEGTNYYGNTNTATFVVSRDGPTNTSLTVYYGTSGTATNGVDYAPLPGYVTIPAGQRSAPITILPLNDGDSAFRQYDTVVLSLYVPAAQPNNLPAYFLGTPANAGAVMLEENALPAIKPGVTATVDNSLLVSLPATNGGNYCLQVSTNLVNWIPVCTNAAFNGSVQYVDPNGGSAPSLFYRAVPVP